MTLKRPAECVDDGSHARKKIAVGNDEVSPSVRNIIRGVEPSPDEDACFINRLPTEILICILKNLNKVRDRKSARLVCQLWYDIICNELSETVHVHRWEEEDVSTFPRFKRLNLCSLNDLPTNVGEMMGSRIRSLEFPLRGYEIENVITQCDNLEKLRLRAMIHDESNFCETLEKVAVVRKRLKTFEIDLAVTSRNDAIFYEIRKRIFDNFFRIFPSIINYKCETTVDVGYKRILTWSWAFSMEDGTDRSLLASAFAWSSNDQNWTQVLGAFSSLRLTNVALTHKPKCCYTKEDDAALENIFINQENLKSIDLSLNSNVKCIKSVLRVILDNCRELSILRCHQAPEFISRDGGSISFSRSILRKVKLMAEKNLRESLVDECSSLTQQRRSDELNPQWVECSASPVCNYSHIHSLAIQATDEILQLIFQHLTNLKSLEIVTSFFNINFGITGRGFSENQIVGYSIRRLRNLEELKIKVCPHREYMLSRFRTSVVDDEIFEEFEFPKLHYLQCFAPRQDTTCFAQFGRKLPSLKIIKMPDAVTSSEFAETVFKCCRTLKHFHCSNETFFYDPSTKKVMSELTNKS